MLELGQRVSIGANELRDEGKVSQALLQVWNTSQLFVEKSKERSTLRDFQGRDSSRMVDTDTDDTATLKSLNFVTNCCQKSSRFHALVALEQAYDMNLLVG